MRPCALFVSAIAILASSAAPAIAQRLPFERSFDAGPATVLDISTIRGKIDVTAGGAGRVVVAGTVTVRVGVDVPANALEIARKIADRPPIAQDGKILRLRSPSDATERRAVTVSYQVRVPAGTDVLAVSDSGATTVRGAAGAVTVRTQSGSIELHQLGGVVAVTTGSGAVIVDGAAGALTASTSSSSFTARALGGSVHVRTSSGAVDVAITGDGDADVETGSSSIRLRGLRGGLKATTQSGRVIVQGTPVRPWTVNTGSGSIELDIAGRAAGAAFSIEAASRSGSVSVEGAELKDSPSKRKVTGTIGAGGPLVHLESGSGSIRVRTGG
jgi:hypothetical protein